MWLKCFWVERVARRMGLGESLDGEFEGATDGQEGAALRSLVERGPPSPLRVDTRSGG